MRNKSEQQSDDAGLYWEAPHIVEVSPAGVACNPRDAIVKFGKRITIKICSPTDDQPSPRQEGEAV